MTDKNGEQNSLTYKISEYRLERRLAEIRVIRGQSLSEPGAVATGFVFVLQKLQKPRNRRVNYKVAEVANRGLSKNGTTDEHRSTQICPAFSRGFKNVLQKLCKPWNTHGKKWAGHGTNDARNGVSEVISIVYKSISCPVFVPPAGQAGQSQVMQKLLKPWNMPCFRATIRDGRAACSPIQQDQGP